MMRSLALLLIVGATSLSAQEASPTPAAPTHPMAGVWRINYQVGMSPDGPINGTGTLKLELKGDSLIGELLSDKNPKAPADVPAPKPSHVAVKAASGSLTIVTTNVATGRSSSTGASAEATVTSTWKLQAKGDSITGTVARELEMLGGKARLDATPVTGTRSKA